jgi:hypothetical protein
MADLEEQRRAEPRPLSRVAVVSLGVLASLIATIVYSIFYTPIMNGVSYVSNTIISPFYSGFLDAPYEQASLGYINSYFFLISKVVICIIFGISGVFIAMSFNVMIKRENSRKIISAVERIFLIKIIFIRIIPVLIIIFIIILLIIISGLESFAFNSIQAAITLDNRLKILAPYITDTDQKILVSEWAQMRTRHDYEQIILKLDHIAKDHGVTLPQPLI